MIDLHSLSAPWDQSDSNLQSVGEKLSVNCDTSKNKTWKTIETWWETVIKIIVDDALELLGTNKLSNLSLHKQYLLFGIVFYVHSKSTVWVWAICGMEMSCLYSCTLTTPAPKWAVTLKNWKSSCPSLIKKWIIDVCHKLSGYQHSSQNVDMWEKDPRQWVLHVQK